MKEEIPLARSDNATIMFCLSFSLEPLSLGETRDPALSKHSRKAHIKNTTVELLSHVAVAREHLEVHLSLIQSGEPVIPSHSYQNHSAKRTQILGSQTRTSSLRPPLMCWIISMCH